MSSPWNEAMPPSTAWRSGEGMTRAARSEEQDGAAGGRASRELTLPDGRKALASIALRLYQRTRRIRAYLRWADNGVTKERYVGEVTCATRAENLRAAWAMVKGMDSIVRSVASPMERTSATRESWASSPATRAVMRANRSRDTKPETLLRSRLHAMGLRYRVSRRPIPQLRRTADIVFARARVAVFVDGCYWHGCPEHHRPARQNADFWRTKIEANRKRDAETDLVLENAGWRVIRVWEHELVEDAAGRVFEAVREVLT